MCATAADLIEQVLPPVGLRQWVLTFPFAWRRRLAHDGALLRGLTRVFVQTVHRFYVELAAHGQRAVAFKSGALIVVQRTMHAATRAGALDSAGREALLRYVLRPPMGRASSPKITQERCR